MGVAEELLVLAAYLADPPADVPEQASLRRAVSTAYYALFHLLVGEAAQRWQGSPESRLGLERVFEHKAMKDVSESVFKGVWRDWSGAAKAVPAELDLVAKTFAALQQARHAADYDNTRDWTRADVLKLVADTRIAFQQWQAIRAEPVAADYLLALLLGRRRG